MITMDYQVVQKRLEQWVIEAAAAVALVTPIEVVMFGEDPTDGAARSVRMRSMRFVSRSRQLDEGSSDSVEFELALELAVSDEVANPARSGGSSHALAYVASAMRQNLLGKSMSMNGMVMEISSVDADLGNMLDALTEAPVGMCLVRGFATQETVAVIAAPGAAVDPAPNP